jgi:hypothetical protein
MSDFDHLPGAEPDSLVVSPKQFEQLGSLFSNSLPSENSSGTLTLADLEKAFDLMRDEPPAQSVYEIISPAEYAKRTREKLLQRLEEDAARRMGEQRLSLFKFLFNEEMEQRCKDDPIRFLADEEYRRPSIDSYSLSPDEGKIKGHDFTITGWDETTHDRS